MITDLKILESELLLAVKDRLVRTMGHLVGNRIYMMEEAPVEAEFPFVLLVDAGVNWPTPDRQGQKQIIPDIYVEIHAFQQRWHGEEPIVTDGVNLGLSEILGEILVALYKQDLANGYHYAVPVETTRSEFFREEGSAMDQMAKFKSLRMLYRKYVNTAV